MTEEASQAVEPPQADVEVTGPVSAQERQHIEERIASLVAHTHRPLKHAHVTVAATHNPSAKPHVSVSARLDLDGLALTAHAAGETVAEAVDEAHRRLERQLSRERDRGRERTVRRAYAWVSRAVRRS
jgi:ribosomal subunit interface protein